MGQEDLFQVKMTSNEPTVKEPIFDKTITYVKNDPRLKKIEKENTLEDLLSMIHEAEGMLMLAQVNIRNLIKEKNGTASAYDLLEKNKSKIADPF